MKSFELCGKFCIHNKVVILDENDTDVIIGMCGNDEHLRAKIERVFERRNYKRKKIHFSSIGEDEWKRSTAKNFSQHLASFTGESCQAVQVEKTDEAPIINLLDSLIIECLVKKGSDIHIEYCGEKIAVRFRIQGYMYDQMELAYAAGDALIQRIKLLSKLEITERRRCQDGRFNYSHLHHAIDIRVSCIPSFFGESVVLRLLDRNTSILTPAELGFTSSQQKQLKKIRQEKNGLVLICGATGSGKTTTLTSILNEMSKIHKKILSIEDPVEYVIEGVVQIPVNDERNLGFDEVLRRIFRQDPDVIVIGEIRDALSAQTAVRSAMTGHLVFATLHTCSASQSVCRFLDLGVQGFFLAPVLKWIIVQELEHCSLKKRKLHAQIIECTESIQNAVSTSQDYQIIRNAFAKSTEVCA